MAKDVLVRLRAENMASEAIARVRQDFVHLVASVATGTAIYNGFKSAVGGAIGFLKESVTAAAEAEKVTAELGRALTTVGATRASDLKGLEDYAGSLSRVSTSSDEAIKSAMSLLVTIGGLSGDTLKRATQAALDLSAATGKDLTASAMGLAKAANGSGGALKKLGIVMDETLPAGQRFAGVLDSIQSRMGGAAETQSNTMLGSLERLHNAVEKFKESLGQIGASSGLTTWLNEAAEGWRKAAEGVEMFVNRANGVPAVLARLEEYSRGPSPGGFHLRLFDPSQEEQDAKRTAQLFADDIRANLPQLRKAYADLYSAGDRAGLSQYEVGAKINSIMEGAQRSGLSIRTLFLEFDKEWQGLIEKAVAREEKGAQDAADRTAESERKKRAEAEAAAEKAAQAWERARARELSAADKIISRTGDVEEAQFAAAAKVAAALGGKEASRALAEVEGHLRAARATAEESEQRLSAFARKWVELADVTGWSVATSGKALADYREAERLAFGGDSPLMRAITDGRFLDGLRELAGDLTATQEKALLLAEAQQVLSPQTLTLGLGLLASARDADQYRDALDALSKAVKKAAEQQRDAASYLFGSDEQKRDAAGRGQTKESASKTWADMTPEQRQRAIAQTNSLRGAMARAYQDSQNLSGEMGNACVNAIDGFASAIANAITSGENFGEAMRNIFRALVAEIIAAIVKMLVLRAIMAAIGWASGGAASGGDTIGAGVSGGNDWLMNAGGPVHAAQGWRVPGRGPLVDSVPALLMPGEVVLSHPEAERYMAGRGLQSLNLGLSVYGPRDLAADVVKEVNALAKRRNLVVVATHNASGKAL